MTVTTRRERRERELRRRQREKRGGPAPRGGGGGGRGLLVGIGVIVLAIVLLLGLRQAGVLTVATPSPTPTPAPTITVDPNDPARGVKETDQGNSHVNPGTPVTYTGALPPSSGSHWPAPAAPVKSGVYDQQVPFEATVHNLEHGGIVIAYNGLSAGELTQLKQFVTDTTKTRYAKLLLEPYTGLQGGKVVAVAWDWRLVLPAVDTGSLLKFIAAHYDGSDAPEPGAQW